MLQKNTQKGGYNVTKLFSNGLIWGFDDSTEEYKALSPQVLGQTQDVSNENFTLVFGKPNLAINIEGLQQRQLLLIAVSFFDRLGF